MEERFRLASAPSLRSSESSTSKARRTSAVLYGNETVFSKIAYAEWFGNLTLVIIVLNAFWIAVDVEWNHPNRKTEDKLPLEPASKVVENLFCVYFTIELLIRFFAFRHLRFILKDWWFMFDGLLVLFMVLETWVFEIIQAIVGNSGDGFLSKFSVLRLLRLLRLTRMTRLIREVPELMTLLKGMVSAARAVSFILFFLLLCMYVFAIVFTAQLGDHEAPEHTVFKEEGPYWERECDGDDCDPTAVELFGSLGDSMMTLFTRGMLADNLAQTLEAIKDRGGKLECPTADDPVIDGATIGDCARVDGSLWLAWLFILFMIISAFCLLNMLIGVLCEVIQQSAAKELETNQLQELKANMAVAFEALDASGVKDGLITAAEWENFQKMNVVRKSLEDLGVEEKYMEERLEQIKETLFGCLADDDTALEQIVPVGTYTGRSGLTFEQFMQKVVEIRPDTPAGALDIEILRVRVEREEQAFNARLDVVEDAISKMLADPQSESTFLADGRPPPKDESTSVASWLRQVPIEVLFAVLHSRAPPEVGVPKVLCNDR